MRRLFVTLLGLLCGLLLQPGPFVSAAAPEETGLAAVVVRYESKRVQAQTVDGQGLSLEDEGYRRLDVPPGNTKPNPYSANAATSGQPTFPWRGRITCSPAAGFAGSVDKTATAATQVSALFGTATPANFSVSGTNVSWTGPIGEWSLRRLILHYAHLCKAAGGVDAFLIGSEMPGLTVSRCVFSKSPLRILRSTSGSPRIPITLNCRLEMSSRECVTCCRLDLSPRSWSRVIT